MSEEAENVNPDLFVDWLNQMIGNMSLKEVAAASGISESAISKFRSKERIPSMQILYRIAKYFNVSYIFVVSLVYPQLGPGSQIVDPTAAYLAANFHNLSPDAQEMVLTLYGQYVKKIPNKK